MAATQTACGFSPTFPCLSPPITKTQKPSCFFTPFSSAKINPSIRISRSLDHQQNPLCSTISHTAAGARKHAYSLLAVSGLLSGSSETDEEFEQNDVTTEATVDIEFPRRRLLVKFTCDLCGERTDRRINRLAYEKGLVYVQCAGCLKYHELVDNLGLVVEHDLREDCELETDTDNV